MDAAVKNIRAMVDKTSTGLDADIQGLNDRLNKVERNAIPTYVVNRRTKRWHKILTTFADAGCCAIAYCGFKYAAPTARCRFETDVPNDIPSGDICGPCLGEIKSAREH